MHLERVAIVNENRFRPDQWGMPGFDLRHLEEPLRCSGVVDNVDNFYYGDYANPDEALINYCVQKKPQALLLSLQWAVLQGMPAPTPVTLRKITFELGIPSATFWFDIYLGVVTEFCERYLDTVTLNVIGGADSNSHKTLPLEGASYVYTGLTFDERLFSRPEGVRDIPVGFLGSMFQNRSPWIAALRKLGMPVFTSGGVLIEGKLPDAASGKPASAWIPYDEYLKLMSRTKVMLNFALTYEGGYNGLLLTEKGRVWEALHWLAPRCKAWLSKVAKNPGNLRHTIPFLKDTVQRLLGKPRYQIRGRVWEALWCRTFLLEENNPVTSLYFEPYVDYVPFTSLKDLVDKIRYYLENEDERDRIRMQGRATVEKYHNARIYWENLFETIGIQSSGQNQHRPGEIWNKAYFDKWYSSHPPNTRIV